MAFKKLLENYSKIAPSYSLVNYFCSHLQPPSAAAPVQQPVMAPDLGPVCMAPNPMAPPPLPAAAISPPPAAPVPAPAAVPAPACAPASAPLASLWHDGPTPILRGLSSKSSELYDTVSLQFSNLTHSYYFTHYLIPLLVVYLLYCLFCLVNNNFQAYLDLGRGGTPSTFRGWIRTVRLKYTARLNVLEPPRVPPFLEPYRGRLYNLAAREGPRPTVKGVAPQRQVDQKASPSTFFRLSNMLRQEADAHPKHLRIDTSFLEGHLQALRKVPADWSQPMGKDAINGPWEFGGEIAHPHRLDGSMHVVLHPEDVRTVIEAGWGERHPLAIATPFWKFVNHFCEGNRCPVPEYLVILYAPLTAQHYAVFEEIVRAAVWFATDGQVYAVDENTYPIEGRFQPGRMLPSISSA